MHFIAIAEDRPLRRLSNQMLRVMQLSAIILLLCCLQIHAKGISQNISFSGRNVELKKVLSEVKKQTGYLVFCDYALLEKAVPVTLRVRDIALDEFLGKVLHPQQLDYSINNRMVVISRKKIQHRFIPAEELPDIPPPIDLRGKITDENGESVAASVQVKGTNIGTTTDIDGNFELKGIENDAVLVITGINIETQEVAVNGRAVIEIRAKTIINAQEEVLVVGYGTQKKATATGAISTVKGEILQQSPAVNFTNTLAGRLPGLVAVNTSGEPGRDNATIRIRGANTLGDNSALVVIDGVMGRDMTGLRPEDIESVTVLKDASAAIYGSRAANGVILITTKRGKLGKPEVVLNLNYGIGSPTVIPKQADAATYATMINEINHYDGQSPTYTEEEIELFRNGSDPWRFPNTDWFAEVFRKSSPQSRANLSIRGGTESMK